MKPEKLFKIFVCEGDIEPELSMTHRISILLFTKSADCLKVWPVGNKLKLDWLLAQAVKLKKAPSKARGLIILILQRAHFIRSPKGWGTDRS